jgi:hypothetical protein
MMTSSYLATHQKLCHNDVTTYITCNTQEIQSREIIMERYFNDKKKLSYSFYMCLRHVIKIINNSGYVLRSFKEQSDF